MLLIYLEKHAWMSLHLIFPGTRARTHTPTQIRPYFPRAKHSSFTADSFAAGTDSGK